MELLAEPSRSFKRRQRRKKQQERRRQADGSAPAGSSDEHEPRTAAGGEPGEGSAPASRRSGQGGHPRTDGGQSGPEHAAREADRPAPVASSGETEGRTKSAKRRKRRSTGPSSAAANDQQAEPAATTPSERTEPVPSTPTERTEPAPSTSSKRTEPVHSASTEQTEPDPSASDQRTKSSPTQQTEPVHSAPTERTAPAPSVPSHCSAPAPESGAEPLPERRRETSPVVSSSREVLRSVRALQTVLGELRTRLLVEPPPAAPSEAQSAARSTAPPPQVTMAPPADAAEAPQKTKEQIKAERKAKAEAAKLAKAAKAQKKQAAAAAGDGDGGDGPPSKAAQSGGGAPAETTAKSKKKATPSGEPAAAKPSEKTPTPAGQPEPEKPAGEKPAGEKSKAELKAERRAKQEAQRAAKAAAAASAAATKTPKAGAKAAKMPGPERVTPGDADQPHKESSKGDRRSAKKAAAEKPPARKGLQMFSHLLQFDASSADTATGKHGVPPALEPLLLRLSAGQLTGGNAGAVALLTALADLVDQYVTPPQRELLRDLPDQVAAAVAQLARRRPLSVAMENVAHRLEQAIRHEDVPADKGDYEAKRYIIDWIETFINDHICKAMTAISMFAGKKITDGDVILTYGRSTTVLDVLSAAQRKGCRFRVIVVDSRPRLDGRDMLRQLLDANVPCSYGLLTAIGHHMKEATKVLLGAQALLSNGMVLSRAGTALVSLTGRALNRPVLVCCETYKFSDRVQTDSQVYNELGDPNELVTPDSPLADLRQSESLSLLNLAYDVTPPELVDVVVTELGAIPCTSVPAVLRLQQSVVY
ncbi:translation initiation factor eIF-2B subunit delta-like isoform X1 [Amphibalanus amphitrite]|uniref:translation initiation factor eIF-2B subunit delta-like isoform X1 n=2 Tax=Amphibalanus amphitrite TaxID=1232801 RepID=UPI001C910DF3|nr:translation initiation factor eIF-2B subunit delta-like isoform X1 [Amphibalanus amphitrite]XP_043191257.1 translation initiation factor eIF-2B subunit delta-like isoform X1 [Amphibalanus amphitrite]XP_043191258.1 translation initiation factor eIF-2B subunit delta-like isoform X1 [Amphibalanus amphitrite]